MTEPRMCDVCGCKIEEGDQVGVADGGEIAHTSCLSDTLSYLADEGEYQDDED